MADSMPAPDVLDREFLEIRAKVLELAASFDRLDRGDGSVEDDPRLGLVREALTVLAGSQSDRAESIQLIFSRPYDDEWQDRFDIAIRE